PSLFQSLSERNGAQLPLRVALNVLHHHCDAPQSITLLGACGERPCGRTGNSFDEIAASHCLPQGSRPRLMYPTITAGIYDRRNGVQGSVCAAAIPIRSCPFGSKADIAEWETNVRFTPKSGHWDLAASCPLCAKRRHSALQQIALLFDHLVGEQLDRV